MLLELTKSRQFPYLAFSGLAIVFTVTSLGVSMAAAFSGGWIQYRPGVYIASFDKNPDYVWVNTLFQIGVMITELSAIILLALFAFLKNETFKRLSVSIAVISLMLSLQLLTFAMIWYPPHAFDYERARNEKVELSNLYWSLFIVIICDAFAITNAVLSFKEYNLFTQYIPEGDIFCTEYHTEEKKGFYLGLKY